MDLRHVLWRQMNQIPNPPLCKFYQISESKQSSTNGTPLNQLVRISHQLVQPLFLVCPRFFKCTRECAFIQGNAQALGSPYAALCILTLGISLISVLQLLELLIDHHFLHLWKCTTIVSLDLNEKLVRSR